MAKKKKGSRTSTSKSPASSGASPSSAELHVEYDEKAERWRDAINREPDPWVQIPILKTNEQAQQMALNILHLQAKDRAQAIVEYQFSEIPEKGRKAVVHLGPSDGDVMKLGGQLLLAAASEARNAVYLLQSASEALQPDNLDALIGFAGLRGDLEQISTQFSREQRLLIEKLLWKMGEMLRARWRNGRGWWELNDGEEDDQ
jgi:hypothetical protein